SITQTQPELSSPPSIDSETDLKFIWIEPNLADYYGDFCNTILPARDNQYSAEKLISKIPEDWIGSRIFLCVSATEARNLLTRIHQEHGLYRIYVLCQNKAEEDQFQRENN